MLEPQALKYRTPCCTLILWTHGSHTFQVFDEGLGTALPLMEDCYTPHGRLPKQLNISHVFFMPHHSSHHKQKSCLGKSLLRKKKQGIQGVSERHTTEIQISITENSTIDEFISNAEAAQRTFEAERTHEIVHNETRKKNRESERIDEYVDQEEEPFCSIPKKPDWRNFESDEASEYKILETSEFLNWKQKLNKLQNTHPKLPLFEKNLEFWREFWKIIEISDVVIQVVDARDPLFFHSYDVSNYVLEVGERSHRQKSNVLLINKADFLTIEQRVLWSEYFAESDINALFFSAKETADEPDNNHSLSFNTPCILSPDSVLELCSSVLRNESPVTIGFLGYPNVGKSSTINRFLNSGKRLQVSATPGKTKHYQTHVLQNGKIILVDGPGLVIPNLKMGKAEMVLAGILPIDNLTEYMSSISLLLSKIPSYYLCKQYGIMNSSVIEAKRLTDKKSGEALQFLSAFGLSRGFMKPGGPDQHRSARLILKDYVQGKILYAVCPPHGIQSLYQPELDSHEDPSLLADLEKVHDLRLTETFIEKNKSSGIHVRGLVGAKKIKRRKDKAKRIFGDQTYFQ